MKNNDLLLVNNEGTNKQTTVQEYAFRTPVPGDKLLVQTGTIDDQYALSAEKFAANDFNNGDLFLTQRGSDLMAISGTTLKQTKPVQLEDTPRTSVPGYRRQILGDHTSTWERDGNGWDAAGPNVYIYLNDTDYYHFGTAFLPDNAVVYRGYKSQDNTYAFCGLRVAMIGSNGVTGGGQDTFQPLYMAGMSSSASPHYAGKWGSYWWVAHGEGNSVGIYRSNNYNFTSGVTKFTLSVDTAKCEVLGMFREGSKIMLLVRDTDNYQSAWIYSTTNNGSSWTKETTVSTGTSGYNGDTDLIVVNITSDPDERHVVKLNTRNPDIPWLEMWGGGDTWIDLEWGETKHKEPPDDIFEAGSAGLFARIRYDVYQLPTPTVHDETSRWWYLTKVADENMYLRGFGMSRINNQMISYNYDQYTPPGTLFPVTEYYREVISSSVFIP